MPCFSGYLSATWGHRASLPALAWISGWNGPGINGSIYKWMQPLGTSPGENCSCLAAKTLQKCDLLQVIFQLKTFHESMKMDCKNQIPPVSIFLLQLQNFCVSSPIPLEGCFILIQEFFKDANAFSVSLANQECFSVGNFP